MFLGIDLGTSEVKVLLLDEQHRIVATTGERLTLQRPQPLWSEQHPADWWIAMDTALQRLATQHASAMAAVQAIGLSGQMHGAVLLDAAGEVLRPAILWNDGRSGDACAALEAAVPRLHDITGNLAMPGFTAPKLWWVREHEPALFEQVRSVLLPKDWLRWRLTGEKVSEMSDAVRDAVARCRPASLVTGSARRRRAGHRAHAAAGGRQRGLWQHCSPRLATRWGLRPGIPIAGGGGDNAASAVGIGAVRPGQGFVSLGHLGCGLRGQRPFLPEPGIGDACAFAMRCQIPGIRCRSC